MRLILAIALQAAYQLQNQQSHNAPDLIIAEHRQRADALISMLPSDVQPLVSVCLQEAKKGKYMSAEDILVISKSLVLSQMPSPVLAVGYDQSSAKEDDFATVAIV